MMFKQVLFDDFDSMLLSSLGITSMRRWIDPLIKIFDFNIKWFLHYVNRWFSCC